MRLSMRQVISCVAAAKSHCSYTAGPAQSLTTLDQEIAQVPKKTTLPTSSPGENMAEALQAFGFLQHLTLSLSRIKFHFIEIHNDPLSIE